MIFLYALIGFVLYGMGCLISILYEEKVRKFAKNMRLRFRR